MFRMSSKARRGGRAGPISHFALALALAGGIALGMAADVTPAYAKKSKNEEAEASSKPVYTKGFVEAYKPLEDAVKAAKDAAEAEPSRALVKPMVDSITNNDERFAGGGLLIQLGLKLNDKDMQRDGLTMQLDSGKVAPEKQAQYNYFVGGISWQDKQYEMAKKYFTQAFNLGYTTDDIETLLPATYFAQNQTEAGLAELKRMEQVREAAGSKLDEQALRSGLQEVYDLKMTDKISEWAAIVAKNYPRPDTWNMTASVILDSYDLSPDEALDLYRLLKVNDALKTTREYVDYVNAADVRRLSNEVLPVLQDGISKGVLKSDDVFVKENMAVATDRAPKDRAEADEIADEGRSASNGVAARAAGDNYLSIGMPAKAVEMYQLASQKGGVEADRLQMRTGVAQAEAGDYDAARQTFQQVTGKRAPVAQMWLAYVDAKQAPAAPADEADAPAADAAAN